MFEDAARLIKDNFNLGTPFFLSFFYFDRRSRIILWNGLSRREKGIRNASSKNSNSFLSIVLEKYLSKIS